MDLSQYHTTLAHVTSRRCVHYGSVDRHTETPSDAGHSPSYTITPKDSSPVAGRRVDVACLYIDVAQQPQSHQTSLFMEHPRVQNHKHSKTPDNHNWSPELNGRRPAYLSGCPG